MANTNFFVVKNGLSVGNTTYTKQVINGAGQWIGDPTGVIQNSYDQANSANVLAQAAFNKANTASSNTVVLQTVNDSQNTNIQIVDTKAQAAFDMANTLSGGTATDGWARTQANAAFSKANSALIDAKSYTDGSVANLVNSSPQTLDTLKELADALGSDPNFATTVSNNIGTVRNTANAAFDKANSTFTFAQSSYDTANTANASANYGVIVGQAAFNAANNVTPQIQPAFDTANAAFDKANVSNSLAQSAFDEANTKLSLSGGTVDGNVTLNILNANTLVHTPIVSSPGGTAFIELTDIGIVQINPSGSGSGPKIVGKSIEGSVFYGGNYGRNFLSVDNETKLGSTAWDEVKIVTGTTGVEDNTWRFSNNHLIFPDNTYQNTAFTGYAVDSIARDQSNTGIILAQSAYAQGNTNSANISTIELVNVTQNTNILLADSKAQAAFDKANTGVTSSMDQVARDTANSAFDKANSDLILIQSAYDSGNSTITFTQAAFDKSNNNTTNIAALQLVNATQNTNIASVSSNASAAFTKANSAQDLAQSAYNYANTITGGGGGTTISLSDDNTTNNIVYLNFSKTTTGTVDTLYTASENLTYNPSAGKLGVNSIDITANTNLSSSSLPATGSSVVLDSFSVHDYRSAFYQIQINRLLEFEVLNLNLVHNHPGTSAWANTFGNITTTSSLGSFDAVMDVENGVVNLVFTPTYTDSTDVTFHKTMFARVGLTVPAGDLGFVTEPVTVTFNCGFDLEAVTATFDYGTI